MRPYLRNSLLYRFLFLLLALTGTAQGQFNFPGLGSKQSSDPNQMLDQYVGKLLGENLPLTLNANDAYPTVPDEDMLGGPFHGRVLPMTIDTLTKPLPPGDYVVPMTFFCSEYSVHRSGGGIAYALAPAEGHSAQAISTLLWRGMLLGKKPQELQVISWAIQGGVTYDKMPPKYKKTIDELIPDMKGQLNGQGFAQIQNRWNNIVNGGTDKLSQTLHIKVKANIPIEAVFARLGPLGRLALDGERITNTFSASYLNDEKREQTLFAGQGEQLPSLPAVNGPWSVKIPGVAYMRFVVKSGNLQGDNVMQIRILPPAVSRLQDPYRPRFMLAGYHSPAVVMTPTLIRLFAGVADDAAFAACTAATEGVGALGPCEVLGLTIGGMTAYALGGTGAQAPIMVPAMAMTGGNGGGGGGNGNGKGSGGIPKEAESTKEYIDQNGGNLNAPGRPGYGADGKGDGTDFKNLEGKLPKTDANGNKITYREWDIKPKQGNRGTDRVVTGSDGKQWFTPDHYKTFTPMN